MAQLRLLNWNRILWEKGMFIHTYVCSMAKVVCYEGTARARSENALLFPRPGTVLLNNVVESHQLVTAHGELADRNVKKQTASTDLGAWTNPPSPTSLLPLKERHSEINGAATM